MAIEIDIKDEIRRAIEDNLRVRVSTSRDSDGDAVIKVALDWDGSEIDFESDYIVMPKESD